MQFLSWMDEKKDARHLFTFTNGETSERMREEEDMKMRVKRS